MDRDRISAASRSSRGRNFGSFCTIVTWEPKLQKACASSQPNGPPPMTARRFGRRGYLEDRLARAIARSDRGPNIGRPGSCARGDERLFEMQAGVADEERVRAREPGSTEENVYAMRGEFMNGMVFRIFASEIRRMRAITLPKFECEFVRDRRPNSSASRIVP